MLLHVPSDRPTLTEAVALARAVRDLDVGLVAGPLLLSGAGGGAVASLAAFGTVMADARLSGGVGIDGAARHLAAAGARRITVDGRSPRPALEAVIDGLRPHGTTAVIVPLPPEADAEALEWATQRAGRGRVVSRCAAGLDGLDVEVLGMAADAGVVAQVAPAVGLVAWGLRTTEEVADAVERGARAGVVAADVVDDRDPVTGLEALVEAASSG